MSGATMLDYEATMRIGADRYRKEIRALNEAGWKAEFTQTGGMNAAIEVQLEAGCTLLICDAEDSLSWDRADQNGWGVAFYVDPERYIHPERYDGHMAFANVEIETVDSLLALVDQVVREGTKELIKRHRG
jgi:hypothetical protein